MKLHVEVTAEDIRNGEVQCTMCPIALAINRVIPGAFATIFRNWGRVSMGNSRLTVWLPGEASAFVSAFDGNRGSVAPFSFDLDLPEATP